MRSNLSGLLATLMLAGCGSQGTGPDGGPTSRVLEIVVATTGVELDPDGYRLAIDADASEQIQIQSLVRVNPGHIPVLVEMLQVADNCAVAGENPRTVEVPAGDTARTEIAVVCSATGTAWPDVLAEFAVFCADPPAGRFKLVFERRHSLTDQGDIYVMNDDGTGVLNLTRSPHDESAPAFSPDGRRIAFLRQAGGDQQLCVMAADGSDVRELTSIPGDKRRPVWSPDGRRIALAGFQDVYLIDPDDASAVNLTQRAGTYGPPTWSPDGTALAFANDRAGSGDVYRIDIDAGTVTRLTHRQRRRPSRPGRPMEAGSRTCAMSVAAITWPAGCAGR